VLLPLAAVVALAAHPIMAAIAGDSTGQQVSTGARMLQIFAPQLPLYGAGIVLTGVLQAHRRFAAPVLAPLLSSLTVAAAYFGFAGVDGRGTDVAGLSTAGLLVLALGTTAGVVVLAGCLVPPVARLRLRLRPAWRFDAATRRRVGGLAAAGAVTVATQNLALLVVLWRGLAGPDGSWALFTIAQAIFLLPWAVLAVPVATAAYPGLAEAAATGAHDQYRRTLAGTTRAVLMLSLLGMAALAALALPIAILLAVLMPAAGPESVDRLAAGIAGFAPGLVGYGLFAVLSRALYARGDTRPAALAAALGWAAVAGAAVLLAALLPAQARVLALTAAHSAGMVVLGAGLLLAVARGAGRPAVAGLARTGRVGALAAGLAASAGAASAVLLLPIGAAPAAGPALGSGMLAGIVVVVVFGAVAWMMDRRGVQPMLMALRHRLGRRRAGAS
jgi:putative peptidoglycan lipid II flippase